MTCGNLSGSQTVAAGAAGSKPDTCPHIQYVTYNHYMYIVAHHNFSVSKQISSILYYFACAHRVSRRGRPLKQQFSSFSAPVQIHLAYMYPTPQKQA